MEKYVLIGAGSAMFTRGLMADMIRQGEPCELALVDIDAAALRVAERLAHKMVALSGAPIKLSADTDRRQVLSGATVVICTIGVGGRRAWEQDVLVPRRWGIYQPVGDSVMPGGTSRALRMIPAMVDIARDVVDLAPDALFFNYGNPMAPVCRAVRKATGANIVGLCHGVFCVARYLADALGVGVSALRYSAVGMNHLTWFVDVRANGQDAMPRLRQIAAERKSAREDEISSFAEFAPFSWHLLELFGGFPAAMDRHVTEFFPQFFADGQYYGHRLGVDAFSFEGTIASGDRIFEEMRSLALSDAPLSEDYFQSIGGEHEQVIEIVQSIRQDVGRVYSANLPNQGQVPNLAQGAIVESPAVADGAGLRPITQPALPAGIVGTLATRLAWVDTVVEAALEGSTTKFVEALILDGACRSIEVAEQLAHELLRVQAAHLPQFS